MKCFCQAAPPGCVSLVTPTGTLTLTREQGHRLLYHGSQINVGDGSLTLSRLVVIAIIGGVHYTIDARTLGRLFRGERLRCRVYPAVFQRGGDDQ